MPAPPPGAERPKRSDGTLRVSSTMEWFGAAKPCRALPFQHANLDAVTPPRGHAIFRVQKKASGNQLCEVRCLDARHGNRVFRKGGEPVAGMFQIGISVGQPFLAVPRSLSRAKADSQEWLSYQK